MFSNTGNATDDHSISTCFTPRVDWLGFASTQVAMEDCKYGAYSVFTQSCEIRSLLCTSKILSSNLGPWFEATRNAWTVQLPVPGKPRLLKRL
jgi:hypothetical protein